MEYSITLLRVTEPLEERMEQALFSPPLSKQRVDFALQQIKESCAASLVCAITFACHNHRIFIQGIKIFLKYCRLTSDVGLEACWNPC